MRMIVSLVQVGNFVNRHRHNQGMSMCAASSQNERVFRRPFLCCAAPRVWNGFPDAVRNGALSEDAFAKLLKTYLMNCM